MKQGAPGGPRFEENSSNVVELAGLPGAGKSTVARYLLDRVHEGTIVSDGADLINRQGVPIDCLVCALSATVARSGRRIPEPPRANLRAASSTATPHVATTAQTERRSGLQRRRPAHGVVAPHARPFPRRCGHRRWRCQERFGGCHSPRVASRSDTTTVDPHGKSWQAESAADRRRSCRAGVADRPPAVRGAPAVDAPAHRDRQHARRPRRHSRGHTRPCGSVGPRAPSDCLPCLQAATLGGLRAERRVPGPRPTPSGPRGLRIA